MTRQKTNALIVGASGGIGGALLRQWQQEQRYESLIAACRNPDSLDDFDGRVIGVDLEDTSSISGFAAALKAELGERKLHTVCLCTGFLHDQHCTPERRFSALDPDCFQRSMRINVLGPLMLLQELMPLLPVRERSRILLMSARVGSIADNRLGGWISYRSAKAALNQAIKTLSIELQRTHPECVLTLFHPGTVDTALSAPFQRNVPADKLFSKERAAQQLNDVLHARNTPRAHLFVDWAGQSIEY